MEKSERDFATGLRRAAEGRATLDLAELWPAFFAVHPELRTDVGARTRLAALLRSLAEARMLNFPASKGSYDRTALPILPRFVRLLSEPQPLVAKFDHQTHPWSLPMSFVASLVRLPSPDIALRLNDFFRKNGATRPLVPVKERSYEIFGQEKLLERVLKGQLGNDGRLTLALLRCYRVPLVPVHLTFANEARDVLIVENEATFDSVSRWNRERRQFRLVIYGRGREAEKIAPFLRAEFQGAPGTAYYFGDIDRHGIAIPARLAASLERELGPPLRPALACYRLLLKESISVITGTETEEESDDPDESALAWRATLTWLPEELVNLAEPILSADQRIAQEALGWEKLQRETTLL